MKRHQDLVRRFHERHGFPVGIDPGQDHETDMVRLHLIAEEGVSELAMALAKRDRALVADALADLAYVTLGAAVTYGVPLAAVFEEVHRSNMTKAVRVPGDTRLRCKGDSYRPPDVAGALAGAEAGRDGPWPTALEMWRAYSEARLSSPEAAEAARVAFTAERCVEVVSLVRLPSTGELFAVACLGWVDRVEYRARQSWSLRRDTAAALEDLRARGYPVLLALYVAPDWCPLWAVSCGPGTIVDEGAARGFLNVRPTKLTPESAVVAEAWRDPEVSDEPREYSSGVAKLDWAKWRRDE